MSFPNFPRTAVAVDISSTNHAFTSPVKIYVGSISGGATIAGLDADGNVFAFVPLAGATLPFLVSQVTKVGTAATSMLALRD